MNKPTDVKALTKQFFAAYDDHNVEGMLALCADGAQGRYVPYGKSSVVPIRGGLEQIWRGFPQAVSDFGAEIVEMIQAEENTIVVQALVGGTMPADVPGLVKKGEVGRIAHAYIIRYNAQGKISRLDCYWDNTAINTIKASAL
jgi:ketosteroid isomerase-like protein